ncbi:MAG: glycosyltransferase family 39 protein [Okeania sp. SIO2F4]|uniref:ArnT family glycosyltransferase n=1 Tax=Okeania sp. SIO2F4 TaxID=2607790 RepID=UPI00142C9C48|nr:glycosyltransferase family 39 protein [Okeania sp. SIO2F4]NES05603.1 glycosyltransferase family 39 protein [Okeania sp. SIO2F4]
MTKQINQKLIIFLAFLLLSFFLRFWTLFVSVLDKDESIYILGADSLLNSNLPYIEIWDNKPPGIFILFSLTMLILGNSIVSIRILSIIATTFTSYFLYRIGATIDAKQGEKIGLLAGSLYAIFSLHNDGAAANAEILFAPFVTGAFLLLFQDRKLSNIKVFLIGLILGIGMQIKYLVIMDVLGLVLLGSLFRKEEEFRSQESGVRSQEEERKRKEDGKLVNNFQGLTKERFSFSLLRFYLILAAGLILPAVIIVVIYQFSGYFDEYIYATLIANTKYVGMLNFSWSDLLSRLRKQVLGNILLWLCLFWSPIYLFVFARGKFKQERNFIYLFLWLCCAFLAVLLSKRFYNHYFLQLLPPLCLISGYVIIKSIYWPQKKSIEKYSYGEVRELKKISGKTQIATLRNSQKFYGIIGTFRSKIPVLPSLPNIILFLILIYPFAQAGYNKLTKNWEFIYYRYIQKIDTWDDREALIAKYLRQRIKSTDYIYVVNYEPIIYYLVPTKIPTKYAFPSHLTAMSQILPINPLQELDEIMAKNPSYILLAEKDNISPEYRNALNQYLEENYFLENTIQNVGLYRYYGNN